VDEALNMLLPNTRSAWRGPPIRYAQMRRVLPWMMAVVDVRPSAEPCLLRILKLGDSSGWNIAARRALTRRCYRGPAGGAVSGGQAELPGPRGGLGAVGGPELAQDVGYVLFHGVEGDHQLLGDARVRGARGQ
jgi:hypothetical protein